MPRVSIIIPGTAGVDMRNNPLFLTERRAAAATNLTFDEGTIKVRFDIKYHDLGLKGQWQGGNYVTPSLGLSATTYSSHPSALVNVVDGIVSMNAIDEDGPLPPMNLVADTKFKGNTFVFGAENFVIVLNQIHSTYWWKGGFQLHRSPGLQDCSDGSTHDTTSVGDVKNWLPCAATVGHYIHGRNHISVDYTETDCPPMNSELWVSDILSKRSVCCSNSEDILAMEEAQLDTFGGPLVAPSRLGRTLAFETLLSQSSNGEGLLIDFRENGVVTHNTLITPRESLYDGEGNLMQEGWDEKRITTVVFQTISATGPYAVVQLPDDIWFRSEFGFHYFKKVLGEGTVTDEKRNVQSNDIQPLIDLDEDGHLEGAATGYWLAKDRLMGTVGFRRNKSYSSSAFGRGIVVLNQASTITEDETPRPLWEGLWLPDSGICSIHRFSKAGHRSKNRSYGIIVSDVNRRVFYGEFQKKRTGVDTRSSKKLPIRWHYTSGAFIFSGVRTIDALKSAVIDLVGNESTGPVKFFIRTDENLCWKEWATVTHKFNEKFLLSTAIGEPPKGYREATWFQFRIEGSGYVELRTFDVEFTKVVEKEDGRKHAVPLCCEEEDFFNID